MVFPQRLLLSVPLAAMMTACSSEEETSAGATIVEEVTTTEPRGDSPQLDDLLLRTRREKHVQGKPEWMLTADLERDGSLEVLAATHTPGRILLWRDPHAEPERIDVGDYPLRPVTLGDQVAVASRADLSLVLYDLSSPGEPVEVYREELADVPMVITAGVLDESRGEELFVVTKRGLLLRAGKSGVTGSQELGHSSPRCAIVLEPEAGLVVGFQDSETLEIYRAGSAGEDLVHQGSWPLDGTPRDLLGMDLDGSGDRELLVVEGEYGGWVLGAGTLNPFEGGAAPRSFKTTAIPLRLLPMEQASSPRWSVLAASSVACEVWDWEGGDPRRLVYSYAGQTPRDIVLRDIEGDGRADFWVANRDAHVISLLRNDDRGPIQPVKVSVGTFPNDLATTDLDGDGLDELFIIDAKDQRITVLSRKRDEQMSTSLRLATGPSPRAVLGADIDADGAQDLLWLDRTTENTRLNVRLGDGLGGLAAPEGSEPLLLGKGSRDFVVENFNGAASAMVVAADQDSRRLLWTRAVGGPEGLTFTPVDELALPGPPRSIATMYQGDMARGIAVALQTAPDRSQVVIYTPLTGADGEVEWRLLGEIELEGAAIDLAAGDLDGDGIDDLAYLGSDREGSVGGRVQPLLVKGGKPRAVGLFATGLRPQRVLLDDLSGDSRAEIFVANLDSHNVNAWLTESWGGQLSFRQLDDVGAGVGCIALGATDLDGDSDLDLVVVDSANDGVSLIVNETR